MHSRLLSVVLLLSISSQVKAYTYTSYTTHTTYSNQPQQMYGSMEQLAADPLLATNNYLLGQLKNYLSNCRYGERHAIYCAVACNPAVTTSNQLSSLLAAYLQDTAIITQKRDIITLLLQRTDILQSHALENCIAAFIENSYNREKHALILSIAHSAYLVKSDRLFGLVNSYLNTTWNSTDKSEVIRALAANPSIYTTQTTTHATTHYASPTDHYSESDADAVAALVTGAAVGFAAGTILYNLFFDEPTKTTTYTTYSRRN